MSWLRDWALPFLFSINTPLTWLPWIIWLVSVVSVEPKNSTMTICPNFWSRVIFCTILIARSLSLRGPVVGKGDRLMGWEPPGEAEGEEMGERYAPFELSGINEHPLSISRKQDSSAMNFDR